MITKPTGQLFGEYRDYMQKVADLRYASAVLQWDQETYLPPKGAEIRGRQVATLSEMAHELFTDQSLGNLLDALLQKDDLDNHQKRNVELTWEDYTKQKKFPSSFVRAMAETTQKSFHSWIQARKENSFPIFEKDLESLLALKHQEADLLGYEKHPYNALLNDHDKGSSVDLLDSLFSDMQVPLKELLDTITRQKQVDDHFLKRHFPRQQQWNFGMEIIKDLGYDLEAGRQDLAEHPFTINFNSRDVRITTRIDENDLSNMIWSCIHEAGHALYEQGLSVSEYGLPLGEPASFSIHESQSRLWENHIGRSRAFCEYAMPRLRKYFPEQLGNISTDDFYRGINKVEPSFIRTEADELTYHFHVMIRYEIEKKLLERNISTKDIPAYWNEHYHRYLGVTVTDDKKGCLQDVHWSHGSFGYFPTYSQGSLYAAQIYQAADSALPSLEKHTALGDNSQLLNWLRDNVHRYGRFYTSEELCEKVTGTGLQSRYFLDYLLAKYSNIYQF